MSAAKAVADHCTLTGNSHQMNPVLGQTSGWNPYFDMFSQEDLSSISEVLLWKQYNLSIGYTHDAAYILSAGGDQLGLSRSYIASFLMKNGLPYYADGSGYKGDLSVSMEKKDVTNVCNSLYSVKKTLFVPILPTLLLPK